MRVAKQRSVKELEALRRQCLRDGTKYKNIAVGPPKFLYWRFEHVKGVIRENWQFQYKHPVGGQSMKVGLGSCADVTLAEARERGTELLRIASFMEVDLGLRHVESFAAMNDAITS